MPGKIRRKILVVEDEPTLRLALQDALEAEGCQVHTAENGNSGIELYRKHNHEIILTDMVMPGLGGLELIEKIKEIDNDSLIFAFTAYGNIDTAVRAMKLGAVDFMTKPFRISDLVNKIRRVVEHEEEINNRNNIKSSDRKIDRFGQMIGKSKEIQMVYDLIETVAESDANIVIRGESGTGKELAASAIHFNSPRRDHPFIKVSCASLPETLLESELFGHEKGAFTGALHRKIGRFEQAHKGTLFLDEIGDISENVQIKLLRVLQEREFERVGGTETIGVDVRIVCATHHDIEKQVENGGFREDLYYRINTLTVSLPTLAQRGEDIRLLAENFRELHAKRLNRNVTSFEESVYELFEKYPWPGNIRELKNVVERAVVLCQGPRITMNDLPPALTRMTSRLSSIESKPEKVEQIESLDKALKRAEKKQILIALKFTEFNRTKAAEILGISRKTLWEKMRLHDIEKDI